jgi:hypothetical protein
VRAQIHDVRAELRDRAVFDRALTHDPYADTPGHDLLRHLRGKDVVVVFVESYGRVAVEGSWFAPMVDETLADSNTELAAMGYSARSGWLRSPTFGGISWLAHSTLQTGLWIDSQQRYDSVLAGQRFNLSQAFARAGWRTVSDIPSDDGSWAEGRHFYGFDRMYNARNVGYDGPRFSYARIPDQFTLKTFAERELDPRDRPPVMAEIDLVSSHTPWTPLPRMVPWHRVGDGSVYDGMRRAHSSFLDLLGGSGPAAQLRPVDPVLTALAGLVRAPCARQEPRAPRARRPPAEHQRERHRRLARRTGLADRPRPVRPPPHLGVGLDARAATRQPRARAGDGPVPRPVPGRVRLTPGGVVS